MLHLLCVDSFFTQHSIVVFLGQIAFTKPGGANNVGKKKNHEIALNGKVFQAFDCDCSIQSHHLSYYYYSAIYSP